MNHNFSEKKGTFNEVSRKQITQNYIVLSNALKLVPSSNHEKGAFTKYKYQKYKTNKLKKNKSDTFCILVNINEQVIYI